MTIQPAFEYADNAFCLFNPVVFSCFLWQDWQRNAQWKKNVGHEKVGSIGQKNDGDAHPIGMFAEGSAIQFGHLTK